jgi:tripartite-type tricarboxylate transporter receptor subunit TctC
MRIYIAGLTCIAALAALMIQPAFGQTYPVKAIRVIIAQAPGSATDVVSRVIGNKLAESLGQQLVVDARPGAGGTLGTELAARAAPDGYTLFMANNSTHGSNPALYSKLAYDAVKDFAPITTAVNVPFMIAAHPSVAANSMTEFIALARAKPGTLKYSTPGAASSNHLAGALLESMAGIKLSHIPYKGSGPATIAALSGEVDIVITGIATVTPHWKAGKLKILAIGADKRHPSWPEIASTGEAGLPGYYAGTWFGVVTRAGTPRTIIDKLNREAVAALAAGELNERLTAIGFDVFTGTPEDFARFMQNDMARAARVIKAAGIKAAD